MLDALEQHIDDVIAVLRGDALVDPALLDDAIVLSRGLIKALRAADNEPA